MRWRQSPAAVAVAVATAVALLVVVLGACGGGGSGSGSGDDEGSGDGVAADVADDTGDGDDGGGDDDGGGGDGGGGSPPTAGPGEAGVFTGPSGGEDARPGEVFLIPGCPDIHTDSRLAAQEYEQLLEDLRCIFDHPGPLPEGALEEARKAEARAHLGIEIRDEATGTTDTTEPSTTGATGTTEPATTEPAPGTTEPATTEPTPVVDPEPGTTTSG